jgi:hypothetical protein
VLTDAAKQNEFLSTGDSGASSFVQNNFVGSKAYRSSKASGTFPVNNEITYSNLRE